MRFGLVALCALAACAAPRAVGQAFSFAPAHIYAEGTNPYSIALADFNRDGTPDVAVGTGVGPIGEVTVYSGAAIQTKGTTFTGRDTGDTIDSFIANYNEHADPFVWTSPPSTKRHSNRVSLFSDSDIRPTASASITPSRTTPMFWFTIVAITPNTNGERDSQEPEARTG